jgi:hypothetical protein
MRRGSAGASAGALSNASDAGLPVAMPIDQPQCAEQTRPNRYLIAYPKWKIEQLLLRPYLSIVERYYELTGRRLGYCDNFGTHTVRSSVRQSRLLALAAQQLARQAYIVTRCSAPDRGIITSETLGIVDLSPAIPHTLDDRIIGGQRQTRAAR